MSVLSGVALLIAPLMAAHVQIWWIGAYALASGIMMIVSAFKLRGCRNDAAAISTSSQSV